MRLRKVSTDDVTGSFTDAAKVTLEPSIAEIKASMAACVLEVVTASHGFPRPEQVLDQVFGGAITALL